MNLEIVKEKIDNTPALLLYFSGEYCSVCHDLKPKVFKAMEENYPKMEILEISVDVYKDIAASFEVFALPSVLIFLDGKQFVKKTRSFGVDELINDINRPYNLFFGS